VTPHNLVYGHSTDLKITQRYTQEEEEGEGEGKEEGEEEEEAEVK
jgi:hypothetical protein